MSTFDFNLYNLDDDIFTPNIGFTSHVITSGDEYLHSHKFYGRKIAFYQGFCCHDLCNRFIRCRITLDAASLYSCLLYTSEKLRDFYDFIIIGCMPSLGMMTIKACSVSHPLG